MSKSRRGVPAGQCAGAAAGTPLQHHTSVPHRGICYLSATFVTIRRMSTDVRACSRDMNRCDSSRSDRISPNIRSLKTDQIQPAMNADADVRDGFTLRPSSAVSPSAHRPPDQVHLTGSSVRDGASVSPGFSPSPPRRLCPLPD